MADADRPAKGEFVQAWQSFLGEIAYEDRRRKLRNPNAIDPDDAASYEKVQLHLQINLDGDTMALVLRNLPSGEPDEMTMADFIRRIWGDPYFFQATPAEPQAADPDLLQRPRYSDFSDGRAYNKAMAAWRRLMKMLGQDPNDLGYQTD